MEEHITHKTARFIRARAHGLMELSKEAAGTPLGKELLDIKDGIIVHLEQLEDCLVRLTKEEE